MLNDKSTSELITKSLAGILDPQQQAAVDSQVENSEQSRKFATLNKLIHDSISDVAKRSLDGDTSVAPGLSQDARDRMKNQLRAESARLSQSSMEMTLVPDLGVSGSSNDIEPSVADEQFGQETATNAKSATTPPLTLPHSNLPASEARTVKTRFTLQKVLGAGGLGKVWLAHDETLRRNVALKEMNSAAAEFPRAWDRFRREAEITGQLEHPNVVPLYQHGMDTQTGQPFYAMRFVGKRTLVDAIEEYHERMNAGEDVTMDLHRLLTAFIGVCQGIAYAHSRGVIHRDLKPENVALDSFGQVIVLDWGLAKVRDDVDAGVGISNEMVAGESAINKTMNGEVIGTPLYMAPEQASGRLDDVDHRTDVFGLGAILFSILTGYAPHRNSSLVDGDQIAVPELLRRISSEPTAAPADVNSSVPGDLSEICLKAMQFRPFNRYQSATEMSDVVQHWMAGRSERRQQYSNARSECRELRTAMLSSVRDLERNVRFMSCLPPIQGIIDAVKGRSGDDLATWQERLRLIYGGLLRTNCDFTSVSYSQVNDGNFQELIRIERQASESSNVRKIPASRLASGPLTGCMKKAMLGNPDEVYVALASDCPKAGELNEASRLAATVPVFDLETEEEFGFVMIEADLDRLTETLIRDRFRTRGRLFVLDNECRILLQLDRSGRRVTEVDGQPMNEVSPCWSNVLPVLKEKGEYIDERNHATYATRIDLVPGRYSLALALCLAESKE
ncbi:MAG: serine/threonine-protein kinase [Fuerstiella sp.]